MDNYKQQLILNNLTYQKGGDYTMINHKEIDYDWELIKEELSNNIDFTQRLINEIYGENQTPERTIAFHETLKLINNLTYEYLKTWRNDLKEFLNTN